MSTGSEVPTDEESNNNFIAVNISLSFQEIWLFLLFFMPFISYQHVV